MRGDGTLELVPIPADRTLSTSSVDSNVPTFSVQGFVDAAGVSWAKSSSLMKLVTLAAVCNKAKYDQGDQGGKEGGANGKHVAVPMFAGGVEDRKVLGDATDTGLLRYVDKLSSSAVLRMAYKKVGRGGGGGIGGGCGDGVREEGGLGAVKVRRGEGEELGRGEEPSAAGKGGDGKKREAGGGSLGYARGAACSHLFTAARSSSCRTNQGPLRTVGHHTGHDTSHRTQEQFEQPCSATLYANAVGPSLPTCLHVPPGV
jgi:hypothetical protein